ncbi:MAG: tetratricopeptide repeat protein [Candidatus Omnitrophica bacterium]|nr:tetratricopeptide repeat protein [Candidatus Omnitrophota bacterium]
MSHPIVAFLRRFSFPIRLLFLLGLGFLVYRETFRGQFVFDDIEFIVTNPFIKNFSAIQGFWEMSFPKTRIITVYSYALNYYLNKLDPFGYHLFNYIVHIVATLAVWRLAFLLVSILQTPQPVPTPIPASQTSNNKPRLNNLNKGKTAAAKTKAQSTTQATAQTTAPFRSFSLLSLIPFFVTLIFLVHPGQTEAVTYITQRFESLATMFYLLTLCCYVQGRMPAVQLIKRIFLFSGAAFFSICAITSKEISITLPLTIVAIELIFFKDLRRVRLSLLLILFLISCVFLFLFSHIIKASLWSLWTHTFNSESHDGDILTPYTYILTQMRVFLTFFRLLIFPVNQNLEYDYPMSNSLLDPPLTLVGLLFIIALAVISWLARKKYPLISFGIAWILITFSANLVPRANVIFEHKLYLMCFGFALAGISLLNELIKNRKILITLLIGIILIFSLTTFHRNKVWLTERALWEDEVKKSPNKARVHANMGKVYTDLKIIDKALFELGRAIELKADDFKSYSNRGAAYYSIGDFDHALENYNKAIEIKPGYFGVYVNRALIYFEMRQFDMALANLNTAILLDPKFQYGYIHRGRLLNELGRYQEALRDFDQALKIAPGDVEALVGRAVNYFFLGQTEKAIQDFNLAQQFKPQEPLVFINRGFCYFKIGQPDKAIADFNAAIQIQPGNGEAYNKRGMAYHAKGAFDKAFADFNQAIALDPHNVTALNNRASIYFQRGQTDAALADCDQAIALNPHMAMVYNNRGIIYLGKKMVEQAKADFDKSLELDPNYIESYLKRGFIYASQNNYTQALADFSSIIAREPTHFAALYNRGVIEAIAGNQTAAIVDFTQSLKSNPNYAMAFWGRANSYAAIGKFSEALADAQAAQSLGQEVPAEFIANMKSKIK